MEARERKTLQPWVKAALHKPKDDWLCWKIEDAYVPGLPDFLVKSPEGRASLLEIKWSVQSEGIPFHVTREQWAHLSEWGEGAHILVAAPLLKVAIIVPIESLEHRQQTLSSYNARQLPACRSCPFERKALGRMLRQHLL